MAGMAQSASVTGKSSLDGNMHPMQSDAPHRSPSRAGSLPLIGGRLCIDFANTASGREGPRRQEHLRRYPDLIAWTLHAGMLDRSDASILERAAAADPEGARRALEAALQLRESIHDLLLSLVREKAPRAGDLDRLNLALADAMSRARIGTAPDGFAWDWPRPAADPLSSQLTYPIWPIARSAAELLLSPLRDRLRECPGEHCGWLFLDLTKNASRRWCEMKVCGSRAKMQRHRRRRRLASAGQPPGSACPLSGQTPSSASTPRERRHVRSAERPRGRPRPARPEP